MPFIRPLRMTKKSDRFKFLSLKDRNAFFVCLALAMLFWIASKFGQEYDQEYPYTIEYNIPEHLSFNQKPTDEIRPIFSGSGWELFAHGLNKKKHRLDIMSADREFQRLSRSSIIDRLNAQKKSQSLEIKSLNIDFLEISLEEKASRKIPVVMRGEMPIADQFVLIGNIQLNPDSITITGPKSVVEQIDEWDLPLPSREPISASIIEEALLKAPDDALFLVSPNKIEIKAELEALTEKQVSVPITKTDSGQYQMFPDRALVTFSVGVSNFDAVQPTDFEIHLSSVDTIHAGTAVPIQIVRQPEYVRNIHFNPKSVDILVVQDTLSEL